MEIELSEPQLEFVSTGSPYPAFVAGYGAGKTEAGVHRAISKKLEYPKQNIAYYFPTFDLVKLTGFPRFEELFNKMGISFELNKSDAIMTVGNFGQIIFRSMDRPERIVSYEVGHSIFDEIDTLPKEKAREVWNKALGRNRQKLDGGADNTMAVVTTPEGFGFVYEKWKKNSSNMYHLIQAPTSSNQKNLPKNYIRDLIDSYPSSLISAYLEGQFVNLTTGNVYSHFNRTKVISQETVKENDVLHVGMDFNVQKMAIVVFVMRDNEPHAVAEYTDMLDTPATISLIKSKYPNHRIIIYPDASGKSRKSNNASQSDITLLRDATFMVFAREANPLVKDRIMAVNNSLDKAQLKINLDLCPVLVEGLEQQGYNKNGEPDKMSGFDHILDAMGYFMVYKFPIKKRRTFSQETLL